MNTIYFDELRRVVERQKQERKPKKAPLLLEYQPEEP